MIQIKDLSLSLGGKSILHGIDFLLPGGENLVILGRSGSGKTVLTKSLLGIFPPDTGEIIIDGKDIYSLKKAELRGLKQNFAMVFQHAALLDSFSVYQNVALPLYERGEKNEALIQKKVRDALDIVGLVHTLELFPAELSGGMRKRVGIARALVYEPAYIIFDEPVSGLDPITAQETLYYMKEIIRQNSATLITISHDIATIGDLGQKVLYLEMGKQLYFGDFAGLKNSDAAIIRRYFA